MFRLCKIIIKSLFVDMIAASRFTPNKIRCFLYKLYGMNIKSSIINPNCYFASKNIVIGNNVFINHSCCFHNPESEISIGDNTWIAMHVLFTTSGHKIGNKKRRAGELQYKPIKIGSGCWIGANATILPGVTIGDGCVIGAGAIVNKDCEPNGLYVGVPAKRIKDLTVEDISEKILNVH